MVVVARGKEDVSYLSIFLPDIPHTVYQVKADTAVQHACSRSRRTAIQKSMLPGTEQSLQSVFMRP
jgi:hypothetical protein